MTTNELTDLLPAAFDLPTVTSINPGQPPLLVLDNDTVIRLADLPHACLMPETSEGVAVLLTNWRDPDAPVYLVPDSLVPALRTVADQGAAARPPVLVGVELTHAAIICQPDQGRHQVVIPRPYWLRVRRAVPREFEQPIDLAIYTGDPHGAGEKMPPSIRWRVYPDTAEGRAVLKALKIAD